MILCPRSHHEWGLFAAFMLKLIFVINEFFEIMLKDMYGCYLKFTFEAQPLYNDLKASFEYICFPKA